MSKPEEHVLLVISVGGIEFSTDVQPCLDRCLSSCVMLATGKKGWYIPGDDMLYITSYVQILLHLKVMANE